MATYVSLIKYTHDGIKNLKGLPDRLDNIKNVIREAGGELKAFYLAMGQYDAVVITEGPDDETVTKIVLYAAISGYFSSQTFRVFTEEETARIVSGLP